MSVTPLDGKICLITGGAGGLGKAISQAFLEAGATVVVWDMNKSLLSHCQNELGSKRQLQTVELNITEASAMVSSFEDIVKTHGKLDVLVNNAGIMDKFDPVGELDSELWDRVLAVNLTAPVMLTKLAVNHMLERTPSGGSVLNVCSLASARGGLAGRCLFSPKG